MPGALASELDAQTNAEIIPIPANQGDWIEEEASPFAGIDLPVRPYSSEAEFQRLTAEGQHQQSNHNYALAKQKYKEALDNAGCFRPDNMRVLNTLRKLIEVSERTGDKTGAAACKHQIAQMGKYMAVRNAVGFKHNEFQPFAPGAVLVFADTLAGEGDFESAESLYRSLQLNYVKSVETFFAVAVASERLAYIYSKQGKIDKLQLELAQVVNSARAWDNLSPNNDAVKRARLIVYNCEAMVAQQCNHPETGLQFCKQALALAHSAAGGAHATKISPFRYLMIYMEQGRCYLALDQYKEARRAFRRALDYVEPHGQTPAMFIDDLHALLNAKSSQQ
jgi:tetratricopeptide (TPR) repeat protein